MFSHVYIIFFTNDYVKKVNIFKDNPGYEKFMLSISISFLKNEFLERQEISKAHSYYYTLSQSFWRIVKAKIGENTR